MSPRLLSFLFLLGCTSVSFGQDFQKQYSLELGVAPGPVHMLFPGASPSWNTKKALAEKGQAVSSNELSYPAITLSGALRTAPRWEIVATAGVSWCYCQIKEYDPFGVDPQGKPRYDTGKSRPAGWKLVSPVASITIQERVAWNPAWKVRMYSAFGVGLGTYGLIPLPSLTPVGCSYGGEHLYFYAEIPLSPYATFFHAGIGWSF